MPKKYRVFLDTSAILAGLNSPTGAAGVILAACFSGKLIPIISRQVIEEAERNIPLKFPKLFPAWKSFLLIPPKLAPDPTLKEVRKAYKILPTSDAPILAAAMKVKPDVLVTWNPRHFQRTKVLKACPFPILLPGDFLNNYLKKS
jgi:predicted nucleic acid-binding protein